MLGYLLEIDETYRIDGKRTFITFESNEKEQAIKSYHDHNRGMVNLCEVYSDEKKRLLKDEDGRRYVKGSPFYDFPHVPHRSKIDGSEIPST